MGSIHTPDRDHEHSPPTAPSQSPQPQSEASSLIGSENAKAAVIRGKVYGLLGLTVHLIPLAFTAVLVALHFSKPYWFSTKGLGHGILHTKAETINNWLQLAAKLYELFVIASLGSITVRAYKRHLVGTGVPLGLLASAYRVGDVESLLSNRFWLGLYGSRKKYLALLLLVGTLLSTLVGPASAILIIPELGWFHLANSFAYPRMPVLLAEQEYVWPQLFNDSMYQLALGIDIDFCQDQEGLLVDFCPAAGYNDIYTWASGWDHSGLQNHIDFQDPSGSVRRRLYLENKTDAGTFATSLTALTAGTMGKLKAYIKAEPDKAGSISTTNMYQMQLSKSSENYQPLVNADCQVWNLAADDIAGKSFSIPTSNLRCFSGVEDDECHRTKNMLSKKKIKHSGTKGDDVEYQLMTVESEDGDESENPSLSGLYLTAVLPFYNGEHHRVRVAACGYLAHWIPSTVSINSSSIDLIETNVTDENLGKFWNANYLAKSSHRDSFGPMIRIDKSWLQYIDLDNTTQEDDDRTSTETRLKTVNGSTYDAPVSIGTLLWSMVSVDGSLHYIFGPGSWNNVTRKPIDSNDDRTVETMLEKLTSAAITDSIARVGAYVVPFLVRRNGDEVVLQDLQSTDGPLAYSLSIQPDGKIVDSDGDVDYTNVSVGALMDEVVVFNFTAKQYGYGYGQPGHPKNFALVVVFVYVGILLISWLRVIWDRKIVTVAPWSSMDDLLVLAWNSPAAYRLKNQGIKVTDNSVWKEDVSVGATDLDKVTLVLGDEKNELNKIEKNVKYS